MDVYSCLRYILLNLVCSKYMYFYPRVPCWIPCVLLTGMGNS
jgi:hypothetical protein